MSAKQRIKNIYDEDLTIRPAFSRGITNRQDTEKTVDFNLLKKAAKLKLNQAAMFFTDSFRRNSYYL
ncbi:MAG: hypothetical protein ACLFSE_13985 [Spirochaetia bacterium]